MHQATKMLIQAGVIPKNTLQQLVNWRLVPEDYIGSHGARQVSLDVADPEKVGKFVDELCEALTKDMTEIRETELNRPGQFRRATPVLTDDESAGLHYAVPIDLFVDRLGRVITPAGDPWDRLVLIHFDGEPSARKVVKSERRYEGDKVVALVNYLESKEES